MIKIDSSRIDIKMSNVGKHHSLSLYHGFYSSMAKSNEDEKFVCENTLFAKCT
jgi:hypothetical protein